MISMRLQLLYRRLSYLTVFLREFLPGIQGVVPFLLQSIAERVGMIAPVAQQPICFGQAIQQGFRSGVIADLPRRH